MPTDQTSDLDFSDDFFLTALFQGGGRGKEEEGNSDVLVSDAKYAEELQFQEALMSSHIASQIQNRKAPSQSAITVVQVIAPVSDLDGGGDVAPPKSEESGESSSSSASSSRSFCEICFEKKESDEMFVGVRRCIHSFCSDCVSKHVATIGNPVVSEGANMSTLAYQSYLLNRATQRMIIEIVQSSNVQREEIKDISIKLSELQAQVDKIDKQVSEFKSDSSLDNDRMAKLESDLDKALNSKGEEQIKELIEQFAEMKVTEENKLKAEAQQAAKPHAGQSPKRK